MSASLRAALSGADLLGFTARRDDAPSAKAAFVGHNPQFPSVTSGGAGGAGGGGGVSGGAGGAVGYSGGAAPAGSNAGGGGGGAGGDPGGASNGAGGAGGAGGANGGYVPSQGGGNYSGAGVNGVAGQAGGANGGGGGGGGGGGVGVIAPSASGGQNTYATLVGTTTGGVGGNGGAAGAGSGSGGQGGVGGAGFLAFGGLFVDVGAGASVTGGMGGGGGAGTSATTNGRGGDGGDGVLLSLGGPVNVAINAAVTGGAGGGGPGVSGNGGAGVDSGSQGRVYSFGGITGGSGGPNGDGGAGVRSYVTLNYAGSITGGRATNAAANTGGAGVAVAYAGYLHNYSGATITGGAGAYRGGAGVSATQNCYISNDGAITGGRGGQGGAGVLAASGSLYVNNTGSGVITGGYTAPNSSSFAYTGAGVYVSGYGNTITNAGSITGGVGSRYGAFANNTTVTNTGTIAGGAGRSGVTTGVNAGVALAGRNVTIVNSGTIAGGAGANGTTGYALELTGTSALTLSATNNGAITTGTITGVIAAGGTLSIDPGTAASVTLTNVISDFGSSGAITKVGANTLVLTGASTYTGATTVSAGVLEIGQGGSLTSAIIVSAGTLRGAGSTTGAVSVASGATFAPGNAAGAGAFTIGTTAVNGAASLSLPTGAIFAETLTGANAYGTANVAGQVTLGGSLNLTIAPGAVLPVGTVYTLIHEAGVTTPMAGPIPGLTTTSYPAVSGTFAGYAEASSITVGGYTFRVSYVGGAHGDDVTLTETAGPVLAVANTTPNQAITDKTTAAPFAGVTLTDPTGGAETATITYTAANGTLTGAGLTGSAGNYTLTAASDAALNTALHNLVFTPTANQVAPTQTVATTLNITVRDASGLQGGTSDTVTTTSVNDAPTVGGLSAAAVPVASATATRIASGLTVSDLDVNASATSAQVAITSGFVAGDVLSAPTLPGGVTAAFNAATGVLTLTGASSDANYQAALDAVTFVHNGAVAAGSRMVSFTVIDDQGAASAPATETLSVGAYSSTPTTTTAPQTASQQAGYTTQTDNLLRASPNDPALTNPSSPLYTQVQAEQQIATKLDQGQISAQDAQSQLFHLVDGTTSVAEISYAFFTGKTPTAAGLNYLVHSAANTTDLNDPYYAQFTTENRYINFAANLATGQGAGAAQFQANYGSLSLSDTVIKAYVAIFGTTPTADKVSAILNAQVSNGLGGTETRAQYFSDITGGSAAAQKAAAIGFLLSDSVKEGFGAYQQADLHFLQDLAHGTAAFNVDLLAAYSQAPNLVGQPTVDATFGG